MAGQEYQELIQHLRGIRHIVINTCHGGFGLSREAELNYLDRAGIAYSFEDREDRYSNTNFGPFIMVNDQHWNSREIARDDPALVAVIRDLGEQAAGPHAELKIVSIPADVAWQIDEYDGWEWVAEQHRTWS
jgi:hypothetical protein